MSNPRHFNFLPHPIVIDFEGVPEVCFLPEDHQNNNTDIQRYRFATITSLADLFEGEPLYRGTIEPYSDVFQNGFTPRGTNIDIASHVLEHHLGESAYISTSLSKEVAVSFPKPLRGNVDATYVYQIHSTQSPINIVKEFVNHATPQEFEEFTSSALIKENEMAFSSKINSNEIKGCWKVTINTKVDTAAIKQFAQLGYSQEWINEMCYEHTRSLQSNFIANPNYRAPGTFALNSIRGIGVGLTGIGLALDGYSLYKQYQYSKQTGNYQNTFQESNRILSGWTGTFQVGSLFAEKAFLYSAGLSPFGQGACTIGAGFIGSILGYYGGSHIATASYTRNFHQEAIQSTKTINQNGLTCHVATYASGTRIGKCVVDNQLSTQNSINKPSETQKATDLTNHVDFYLGMQQNLEVLRANPALQAILSAPSLTTTTDITRLERMQNNLAMLQQSSPSLCSSSLTLPQSTSSTKHMMDSLRTLNDSHHNLNQCLATNRCDSFSQFTNASRPTHYTNSAAQAAEYTAFFGNYMNMNFCESPRISNNGSSMWGRTGNDNSGKHCDIFGNCSSSSSNDCRSSSSDRCSSSLFK